MSERSSSGKRRRDTPPPPSGGGEKEVLLAFLDYLRESAAAKLDGVPEPQVRTPQVASGTNLLGLIKHLTHVERFVFLGEDVADWQSTFTAADEETVEGLLVAYREAVTAANALIAEAEDLAVTTPPAREGHDPPTLRWALTHMIEETGRHAGHLDITRELLDGGTGR